LDGLKLNQINIPGTHNSGTYDLEKSWKLESRLYEFATLGLLTNFDTNTLIAAGLGISASILGNTVNYITAQIPRFKYFRIIKK